MIADGDALFCCDALEGGVPVVVCSVCGLFTFAGRPHASRVRGPVADRAKWRAAKKKKAAADEARATPPKA